MSEDVKPEQKEGLSALARKIPLFLRWARRMLTQRLPAEEARDVRRTVEEDGRFTERFALLSALSAGIATLGLLQSSPAVVIGAMLVSPLMGPIASLGFGFASLDGRRIQNAAQVVGMGALIGVAVGMLITGLSPIRNATPEIIARTAPTLLDLGVALLSGFAGGYATVHRKGETAIGVAIATALMPPLATLGFSIAVFRLDFAMGALLLFLTNLGAIAFSFAVVAHLRGVARPLRNVEFKPRHVILGAAAFLLLATPLTLTLRRITEEAYITSTVRREVARELRIEPSGIAQISVTSPLLEAPAISVTAVTPEYHVGAQAALSSRLARLLRRQPDFSLRQVIAADTRAQTQAMIEAALAQSVAQNPPPPIEQVRRASRIPFVAAWADEQSNTITLSAPPIEAMTLAAYRAEETRLNVNPERWLGWSIAIAPPFQGALWIPFEGDEGTLGEAGGQALDSAVWALSRWRVKSIIAEGMAGRMTHRREASEALALARAEFVAARLGSNGIAADHAVAEGEAIDARIGDCGETCANAVRVRVRQGPAPARPETLPPSSTPTPARQTSVPSASEFAAP